MQTDPADNTKCLRAGCQPLEAPQGGRLTCTSGPLRPGSVCSLNCKQGYVRSGAQSRTCGADGEWDEEETPGRCTQRSCPALPAVDNGQLLPIGCTTSDNHPWRTRCRAHCSAGYQLLGSASSICGKRGRWVQRQGPPTCHAVATRPESPVGQVSPPPPPPQPVSTLAPNLVKPSAPSPRWRTSPVPTAYVPPYIICPPDLLVNLTQNTPYKVCNISKIYKYKCIAIRSILPVLST